MQGDINFVLLNFPFVPKMVDEPLICGHKKELVIFGHPFAFWLLVM